MKIITIVCVGAMLGAFAESAVAQSGTVSRAQAYTQTKPANARHVKKPRAPDQRDPYAKYWNDPSRQAPPFSWGGPKGGG
jgi:hypothetical protein